MKSALDDITAGTKKNLSGRSDHSIEALRSIEPEHTVYSREYYNYQLVRQRYQNDVDEAENNVDTYEKHDCVK